MKKHLCLLLAFTLLLIVPVSSMAATHTHNYSTYVGASYEYDDLGSTHRKYEYGIFRCSCGESIRRYLGASDENHDSKTYDGGHMGGGLHRFINKCSKCGHVHSTFTVSCGGPPCLLPY